MTQNQVSTCRPVSAIWLPMFPLLWHTLWFKGAGGVNVTLSPLMCGKRDPPVAVVTHAGHSAKPSLGVTNVVKSQLKPGLNELQPPQTLLVVNNGKYTQSYNSWYNSNRLFVNLGLVFAILACFPLCLRCWHYLQFLALGCNGSLFA